MSLFICNVSSQDSCAQIPAKTLREITAVTMIDFFTTFSGMNYINAETVPEKNNFYLYYNLTLNNKIKAGQFSLNTFYFSEFGIRNYKDSITTIAEDQYNIKNSLSFQFGNSKFALNIGTNSKSQYFKHYEYKEDSIGNQVRYLYTSYQSPGYQNFSAGLKYEANKNTFIEIGLINGKRTLIKNQQIFDSRGVQKLYGLEKGTRRKSEFGINLILTLTPHEILKNLYFENFSQFNVNHADFDQLIYYRADINHAFHYIFLKHFRLTLRSLCLYDRTISRKLRIANHLSIGFYVNNRF